MSTPGAVEPVVDGMHRVHAHAAAGNLRSKQWAIKVCAEIFARASVMALMLSRTLAERGYGPEITEPMARAGIMAQAAAMACGEADSAITSLANMTVGDLADSPRQAPNREELSEDGGPGVSRRGVGTAPPNTLVDSSAVRSHVPGTRYTSVNSSEGRIIG
jgi:hypothetical protein